MPLVSDTVSLFLTYTDYLCDERSDSDGKKDLNLEFETPAGVIKVLRKGNTGNEASEKDKVFVKNLIQAAPSLVKAINFAKPIDQSVIEVPVEFLPECALKMATEGTVFKNPLDGSLSDLVIEIGYSFTASVEECKAHLRSLSQEMTPSQVSRTLSAMMRTLVGLDSKGLWGADGKEKLPNDSGQTWNAENFVQALVEICPKLQWEEVVLELDHPGFQVYSRSALVFLTTALNAGLKSKGQPIEQVFAQFLYRRWKYSDSQMSLITQVVKNPDIVSLVELPHTPVSTDILKILNDGDNKELSQWKSAELLEILLFLAENGQYSAVQELVKVPVQHCPDVLVLGLIQLLSPMTQMRQELIANLIPIFLGNHPNGGVILHHAWHAQTASIKSLVIAAMADWYVRGDFDQSRLSRILDVAQDLKGLSVLLNAQFYAFIIDLACLAARREYLKLDKWITDKIREHGEPFVVALVKSVQRRIPHLTLNKDEIGAKSSYFPVETLVTILNCLQSCAAQVSQELSETIVSMNTSCNMLLQRARAQQQQAAQGLSKPFRGGMDTTWSSSGFGNQFMPSGMIDPAPGLSSGMSNLSIGTSMSSSLGLGGLGGPTIQNSPAKIFNSGHFSSSSALSQMTPSSTSHFGLGLGMPSLGSSIPSSTIAGGNSLSASSVSGFRFSLAPQGSVPDRTRQSDITTGSLFPEASQSVSKDIDAEATSYFQRIYSQAAHASLAPLAIEEALEMLKRFQESPVKREREVFSCMLKNLFEEYRFFPQYPEKELNVTAQLFGGIIEHGLVTYMALGIALRYVLDALRKPPGSKMHFFGTTALERFKGRLKEYPQYCQHLTSIAHFHEFPSHLADYIEYGTRSMEPPSATQGGLPSANRLATVSTTSAPSVVAKATVSSVVSGRPSIANATNIDTLLSASERDERDMVLPSETIQDKIGFIFNNLSIVNLPQKCDEFKELISEDFYLWIAHYLVMKRVSIEFNFHNLYSNFLDTLKIGELHANVVRETFRNIKVLLKSDKSIANFSDRTLLKNLGHWLGLLTLGKNKPILLHEIDMKSLIVEAYHRGQQELLYVIPFVAKVVEACAKSRVFRIPCPWTIAIMNALAELHQEHELKLNLKFEIEVLCKTLGVDVNDLKPGNILKDPERLARLEPQLSSPIHRVEGVTPVKARDTPSVQLQAEEESVAAAVSAVATGPSPMTIQNQAQPATSTATTTPVQGTPVVIPEPRFCYGDINATTSANLAQFITINTNVVLFQANPQLKEFVKPAVERAIQEWIQPVIERSLKIALTTCEQIIRKDFALDPEEQRMRICAHSMTRHLVAGTAMISCREQLLTSMTSSLKNAFMATIRATSIQQREACEQAAAVVAQDNVELACAFIQKTAIDKALIEIDKRLTGDYDLRRQAKVEGRRYCDPVLLAYHNERMPEEIRLKAGPPSPALAAVYDEFARYIPGFLPISEREASVMAPKPVAPAPFQTGAFSGASSGAPIPPSGEDLNQLRLIYQRLALELENLLQVVQNISPASHIQTVASLIEALYYGRLQRDPNSAVNIIQKAVEGLAEVLTSASQSDPDVVIRLRDAFLFVLKAMQDPQAHGAHWTPRQVTRFYIDLREDLRLNLDVVHCLLSAHLISLPQFDVYLATLLEGWMNPVASLLTGCIFATQVITFYLVEGNGKVPSGGTLLNENDLPNSIDMLIRVATQTRQPNEAVITLVEHLKSMQDPEKTGGAPGSSTAMIHSGISQAREFDDPPGLDEKTELLLHEWIVMYHSPSGGRDSGKAFGVFIHQMNLHGILKSDDIVTRFFRLSTQICVNMCYRVLSEPASSPSIARTKCFHNLDAFARLIALLVKHSGDTANTTTKVNLLNKVLGIIAGVLLLDHESRAGEFQQLPYHRLFIMLFLELNAPEVVLESMGFQVMQAFYNTLHILRPCKAPGFAFAWLEIIAHRVFIGRFLALIQQRGWTMYAQLVIDLFRFMVPFLRNTELGKPMLTLYRGTLRLLLVLLHDFPEFLCDYHYGFCDVIPPNCIQMRNLILSAFPRSMRLPDPFTPNLKVDRLPEIHQAPRVVANFAAAIQPLSFKNDLDAYLKTRGPVTFLSELRSVLQVNPDQGLRYNISMINALVLYVGTQAISAIQSKSMTPAMSTIGHSAHMDIFQSLAVNLDTEGRYLFLNAIANQLRFPNSHTYYFSCALLCLFSEANSEALQEQITRVLLERLIVNRPHPWGLLITFIELIKNPIFNFWKHEFVHCAPEIEKLFESVARSCMVQKQGQAREVEEDPRSNE
ncbi:CCR4-NOT transcription complex subunit 1-like isoform X2 [Artemia franciscana]|uniref:CCR4-NOT transcription complex subunit 1-like isoform X2 n=1 Tax=Artemia franciscana TaxID=6661 RepID=UPI0032DB24AB